MKRFFSILAGAVFVAALVFASCGSTEPANTNGSSEGGGTGMSLAILTPDASGLLANETYLATRAWTR
jgi:hypothetical protein